MKCEKCGGIMNKVDDKTMKCESCGAIKNINEDSQEEKKEETQQ